MVFNLQFVSQIDIDAIVNEIDGNIDSALGEYGQGIIDLVRQPGWWPVDTGFSRDHFEVVYENETETEWALAVFNAAHYATYVENAPQYQNVVFRAMEELEFGAYLFRDQ